MVRRATQDNRGNRTAGVDGIRLVTLDQRLAFARTLGLGCSSKAIRRAYTPKGKSGKRPLGIPAVEDRARQPLAFLALEPEWEARFEPNSYGVRPGRGCHDAVEEIFIKKTPKFVREADIECYFDKI